MDEIMQLSVRDYFAIAVAVVVSTIFGLLWWLADSPGQLGWIVIIGMFLIPAGIAFLKGGFMLTALLTHYSGIQNWRWKVAIAALLPTLAMFCIFLSTSIKSLHQPHFQMTQTQIYISAFRTPIHLALVTFVGSLLGSFIRFWPHTELE